MSLWRFSAGSVFIVTASLLLPVFQVHTSTSTDSAASRTPWGDADLQGVSDFQSTTPVAVGAHFLAWMEC